MSDREEALERRRLTTGVSEATASRAEENDSPCEGERHCCCCGSYQPCCDCGQVMPSKACIGEKCWCGAPAAKKVGEEILFDDPIPTRHNLTTYVCAAHYAQMMGLLGAKQIGVDAALSVPPPPSSDAEVLQETDVREAIRKAKLAADFVYGVAWHRLEEVSQFELFLRALLPANDSARGHVGGRS